VAISFDCVLLPPGYAYGFSGGPVFDTRIGSTDGGGEYRVQIQDEPRWRWSALRKNFRDGADAAGLTNWFLARRGALYGFLFLDPADFSTAADHRSAPDPSDQIIGFGDGTTTRFRLRKQYPDPGGMTARAFPRRVVPLLGTASAAVARVLGLSTGVSIAPAAGGDGVVDTGAVFLQMSQEVVLSSAPTIGAQVSWGGYHVQTARFADSTDKGFEATIAGFQADEAPFEIESLPFDDPVPLVPGGSRTARPCWPTKRRTSSCRGGAPSTGRSTPRRRSTPTSTTSTTIRPVGRTCSSSTPAGSRSRCAMCSARRSARSRPASRSGSS